MASELDQIYYENKTRNSEKESLENKLIDINNGKDIAKIYINSKIKLFDITYFFINLFN